MGSVSGVSVWAAELPFPPDPVWRAGAWVMCLTRVDGDPALSFSSPVAWAGTLALRRLKVQALKREGYLRCDGQEDVHYDFPELRAVFQSPNLPSGPSWSSVNSAELLGNYGITGHK